MSEAHAVTAATLLALCALCLWYGARVAYWREVAEGLKEQLDHADARLRWYEYREQNGLDRPKTLGPYQGAAHERN